MEKEDETRPDDIKGAFKVKRTMADLFINMKQSRIVNNNSFIFPHNAQLSQWNV